MIRTAAWKRYLPSNGNAKFSKRLRLFGDERWSNRRRAMRADEEITGSVQILSHIRSGDGFGLHDLRLIERPHVHVAFGGPCSARDVAQPRGCPVEADNVHNLSHFQD